MKKKILKISATLLVLISFLTFLSVLNTGFGFKAAKAVETGEVSMGDVNPYMHLGSCPGSWWKSRTYCDVTFSHDKCSNPNCN